MADIKREAAGTVKVWVDYVKCYDDRWMLRCYVCNPYSSGHEGEFSLIQSEFWIRRPTMAEAEARLNVLQPLDKGRRFVVVHMF